MNIYAILISVSLVITGLLLFSVFKQKNRNQLQRFFAIDLFLLLVLCVFVLLQILLSDLLHIPPVYFDYFTYICACFFPVTLFLTSLVFANTKLKLKKRHLLLFVVPIISLLVLWTNDLHHLFYVIYSINLKETVFGAYFIVHSIYSYAFLGIALAYLLIYSIKNSGFFSKQSILIVIGTVIPVVINALATFGVVASTIYITPITFFIGVSFYYVAIFRFQFLSVSPIALQRIVDRISDSYLILNYDNVITDFNETFLKTFNFTANTIRNTDFNKLLDSTYTDIDELVLALDKAKHSSETFTFQRHFSKLNKYFNIEINNITSKGNFLGTLILFKDITQHMEDMQTIQNNQNMLVEKERLASLGQLVGGIAHNLKTPIMSIAGAAEGLSDLVKEYDSSVGDPEVTVKDHHDIAHDMDNWIEKIKTHTAYMSDIITAVKGQAVTLSEDEQDNFTVEELIKRINILMKHELKNALIDLNIDIRIDNSTDIHGNVNSLVQVVNNLISNAIQAYNGKTNEAIDLVIEMQDNSIVILVADHGCGMPQDVKDKLFKEMITTKGKNGTGLGLFMSYSTIRGHFNGNMTFESELNKGTTFKIVLPIM